MADELLLIRVPLKVKIGLRPNGHADHPDWQQLPLAANDDPAGHMGDGWHYDKTSGHKEATADSPVGMQWGLILVTRQFAEEALDTFPDKIEELTEVEAKDFWETKVTAHVPKNRINTEYLVGLKAQYDLLKVTKQSISTIDAQIRAAVDPENSTIGVCKNRMKNWDDAKIALGVVFER